MAALVALLAALVLLAAAAPELGTVDLSLGGAQTETPRVEQAAPASPQGQTPAKPAWVTDPLSPPTAILAGR